MQELDLVLEATKFMMLGMIIVFSFLYIMVIVVKLQHAIIAKFFPEKSEPQVASSSSNKKDLKVMAAISAAIAHHKNVKG